MVNSTSTPNQSYIRVPALVKDLYTVVEDFSIGHNVNYLEDTKKTGFTSACAYNAKIQLPTLAELKRAYFDKVQDRFVSPEYRNSIVSNPSRGEWTATFLENGKTIIERPRELVYEYGFWRAIGGRRTEIGPPPNGWVVKYDDRTGFPIETSEDRKYAKEIFGDDASYFSSEKSGFRPVFVYFDSLNNSRFSISASFKLDQGNAKIGGRQCHRRTKRIVLMNQ